MRQFYFGETFCYPTFLSQTDLELFGKMFDDITNRTGVKVDPTEQNLRAYLSRTISALLNYIKTHKFKSAAILLINFAALVEGIMFTFGAKAIAGSDKVMRILYPFDAFWPNYLLTVDFAVESYAWAEEQMSKDAGSALFTRTYPRIKLFFVGGVIIVFGATSSGAISSFYIAKGVTALAIFMSVTSFIANSAMHSKVGQSILNGPSLFLRYLFTSPLKLLNFCKSSETLVQEKRDKLISDNITEFLSSAKRACEDGTFRIINLLIKMGDITNKNFSEIPNREENYPFVTEEDWDQVKMMFKRIRDGEESGLNFNINSINQSNILEYLKKFRALVNFSSDRLFRNDPYWIRLSVGAASTACSMAALAGYVALFVEILADLMPTGPGPDILGMGCNAAFLYLVGYVGCFSFESHFKNYLFNPLRIFMEHLHFWWYSTKTNPTPKNGAQPTHPGLVGSRRTETTPLIATTGLRASTISSYWELIPTTLRLWAPTTLLFGGPLLFSGLFSFAVSWDAIQTYLPKLLVRWFGGTVEYYTTKVMMLQIPNMLGAWAFNESSMFKLAMNFTEFLTEQFHGIFSSISTDKLAIRGLERELQALIYKAFTRDQDKTLGFIRTALLIPTEEVNSAAPINNNNNNNVVEKPAPDLRNIHPLCKAAEKFDAEKERRKYSCGGQIYSFFKNFVFGPEIGGDTYKENFQSQDIWVNHYHEISEQENTFSDAERVSLFTMP